ncbi:tRNA-uridine aminocarboxypropyltransferase 1-like isoform X2 [Artemia franciscana]|uniref:tRNA-uridine aminocarboxypropyltransferase 1-like isoform X2 n=1 Tax=Artemia franciscana TaxID=6661 RepID=UPI0032D9CC14
MASPLQRGIAYSSMAKNVKADPFSKLEIKDDSFLNTISGRDICANCYKSRKFYCYSCYIPTDSVKNLIPFVEVALVFPGKKSVPIKEYVKTSLNNSERRSLNKVVFIDSTWNQTGGILAHPNLQGLPFVTFEPRASLFWRYQKGKPLCHLATIEAIYYLFVDYGTAFDGYYNRQYDNILFFFRYMYYKIHSIYGAENLRVNQAKQLFY